MDHYPARYWKMLSNGKIRCELCPHFCKMSDGQRGLCFVRQRHGGQLRQMTYGRSSGFCIDPVEKKPLNHFYPNTPILSFGTAGCNLSCKFCQNWDISRAGEFDRLTAQALPAEIAQAALDHQCKSVALTYNDPIIYIEYGRDVAIECQKLGIHVVAVTSGYINDKARKEFFSFINAANVDLKAFSPSFYQELTGGELQTVLDSLVYIRHKTKVWLEITTLLIPGENDSPSELNKLAEWIMGELGPDTPIHFSAFHPDYKMTHLPLTPLNTLIMARDISMEKGLRYVYTGNVHYPPGDTTFCPKCNASVIERDWYQLSAYHLTPEGKCNHCFEPIVGHFDIRPGNWGAKRKPIRI